MQDDVEGNLRGLLAAAFPERVVQVATNTAILLVKILVDAVAFLKVEY